MFMCDSDTDSIMNVYESDSSCELIYDFDEIINYTIDIHTCLHTSVETLQNITRLLDTTFSHNSITLELLESLHIRALTNIKEQMYNNFGEELLRALNYSE